MAPTNPIPEESIAERVARQRREAANSVLDQETGKLLEYRQLLKHERFKEVWNRSAADEFGRLAQGIGGRIKGTDTIRFIHKHEIPADRLKDVTYIKFVCTIRTKKKDPCRTRATMGGNLINYPEDVGTPTANLLLIKIFFNSVISTPGAKFANADISNFYLMTPLKQPEYAKIKLSDIPEEVIKEYKLHEKATPDGWIYIKVIRGMYGLHPRHVWLTSSRISWTRLARNSTEPRRILPKPDCSQILETQNQTNSIRIGGGRFWHQVHPRKGSRPSHQVTRKVLRGHG
jgi:hypothetical protein